MLSCQSTKVSLSAKATTFNAKVSLLKNTAYAG